VTAAFGPIGKSAFAWSNDCGGHLRFLDLAIIFIPFLGRLGLLATAAEVLATQPLCCVVLNLGADRLMFQRELTCIYVCSLELAYA
jgi:hypothetical protein